MSVEHQQVDANLTPTHFVNDILSACDPSNWDADRNKGDYFRGLRDAYEAIHEIANEYQTAMYGWTRLRASPQALPVLEALSALYEWYDRDGSVGGAPEVFEKYRATLSLSRPHGAPK